MSCLLRAVVPTLYLAIFLVKESFGGNKRFVEREYFYLGRGFSQTRVALLLKDLFYCSAVQTRALGHYFWQSVPVGRNIQRSFQRSSSKWFLNRNPCAQCGRSFGGWVVLQLRDPVFPQVKHTPSVTIGGGCGHWVSIERIFV